MCIIARTVRDAELWLARSECALRSLSCLSGSALGTESAEREKHRRTFEGFTATPTGVVAGCPCLQPACSVSPVALIPPPVLAPLVTRALLASIFLPTPFPLFIPFLPLTPKPVVEWRTPPWTLLRGLHVYPAIPATVESRPHKSYILRMFIWYYYWNIFYAIWDYNIEKN